MLDRHPEWARTCDACVRWEHGSNGELSITQERRPGGTLVELPVARQPGYRPPCAVCPKLDGVPEKRPLAEADDFNGLFAELRGWWEEGRAVGFAAGLTPVMRSVAVLFDRHGRRAAGDRQARLAGEALAGVLITAGILRRLSR